MNKILSVFVVLSIGLYAAAAAASPAAASPAPAAASPKGTPTVAILSPANPSYFLQGTVITIKAAASEAGSTIAKVEFYANSTKIGEVDNAPYTFNWLYPDTGVYQITVVATDAVGGQNSAVTYMGVYSLNSLLSNSAGDGLSVSFSTGKILLGDTAVGLGPHSFQSNRYQFLNGHSYSFGGSVKDPVNKPVFRLYDNGDWSTGTTTDRSVNTDDQTGVRYNARSGIMQIGASDRIDSTLPTIAYGIWPTSGLIINTDEPNTIKGRLMNAVFAATTTNFDSTWRTENSYIGVENNHFTGTGDLSLIRSFIGGYANTFTASIDGSCITGAAMNISKYVSNSSFSGYAHNPQDVVNVSLVSGVGNQFGGFAQFVSGVSLINRTRGGATLGMGNVDFSSLPYTGWGDTVVQNQYKYPLLALGNAYGQSTVRTNALTVLYSGRTQINTTGYNNTLAEADVTPKAALEVVSTNTGVLLPRLTNAQRNAIVSTDLQNGLLLYNTDSSLFQYYNGSAWNSVGSGSGGRWLLSSGANGTVYDSLDNIAIGISDAKGYRLAVNGAAIFNSVKVKATSLWPDYVFHKGYELPGLTELERYIRKYSHLPGVVSAKEAEQNGIDIGENQKVLLKKVEEMTLYLIKQDKQLSEQNARLEAQQKEIDELKALIRGRQ